MTGRALRIALGLLATVAALAVAACGHEKSTVAETEGVYLDLGELKYQVQISRVANPSDIQDREFFRGLPTGMGTALPADEIWFVIFLRVENPTDKPQPLADRFQIVDTQDTKYEPVQLDQKTNPLAYQAGDLAAKGLVPSRDSLIDQSFEQGGMLLFRLKTSTNQNRPLVLHMSDTQGSYDGQVDLDF